MGGIVTPNLSATEAARRGEASSGAVRSVGHGNKAEVEHDLGWEGGRTWGSRRLTENPKARPCSRRPHPSPCKESPAPLKASDNAEGGREGGREGGMGFGGGPPKKWRAWNSR